MKTLVLILLVAAVPGVVHAHTSGYFYEVQSGPYTVDIGYSLPAPVSGEPLTFEFELFDKDKELVPFTSTWVRIESEDGDVVFASGLYNDPFGGPRMNYAFPAEGKYTVHARYDRNAEAIAEAAFPITVLPEEGSEAGVPPYLYAAGAFVVVVLVGAVLVLRRRTT